MLAAAPAPGDAGKDPCGSTHGSAAATGRGAARPRRGAFSSAEGGPEHGGGCPISADVPPNRVAWPGPSSDAPVFGNREVRAAASRCSPGEQLCPPSAHRHRSHSQERRKLSALHQHGRLQGGPSPVHQQDPPAPSSHATPAGSRAGRGVVTKVSAGNHPPISGAASPARAPCRPLALSAGGAARLLPPGAARRQAPSARCRQAHTLLQNPAWRKDPNLRWHLTKLPTSTLQCSQKSNVKFGNLLAQITLISPLTLARYPSTREQRSCAKGRLAARIFNYKQLAGPGSDSQRKTCEGLSSCEMFFGQRASVQTNTARDRTKAHAMQTIPFPCRIAARLTLRALGTRCPQSRGL